MESNIAIPPKKTRKSRKIWPVMLAVKEENFINCQQQNVGTVYLILPQITDQESGEIITNLFTCDGDALAAAARIPKFIEENDVRVIRVSERIVQKNRKPVQTKMTFK